MITPKKQIKMITPKPPWLKRRLPSGPVYEQVKKLIDACHLHTVCQEARCPNIWECFSKKTATFLILGDHCTRNCRFCAVAKGLPDPLDADEPSRVAEAVEQMRLDYVVVTSVTRDDLADGGAGLFASTIGAIRKRLPDVYVEVLTPDFRGDFNAVKTVILAGPDVFNHNLETIARLYPVVRPQADYEQSLHVLRIAKQINPHIITKSGIMMGLGEEEHEIVGLFQDLLTVRCNILTIGQYLQPTQDHLPVRRFVPPQEFQMLRKKALQMGFDAVAAGPFIRSSYKARDLFKGHRLG